MFLSSLTTRDRCLEMFSVLGSEHGENHWSSLVASRRIWRSLPSHHPGVPHEQVGCQVTYSLGHKAAFRDFPKVLTEIHRHSSSGLHAPRLTLRWSLGLSRPLPQCAGGGMCASMKKPECDPPWGEVSSYFRSRRWVLGNLVEKEVTER